jgi:aminoglycoside phosphotransferase family enzyme/predicted kinase
MDADSIAALRRAQAYPHPVDTIELIETHLSWVLLTGEHAYKLKKPVRFDFVDFSTLARREYFCREELRCNQAFAPELYIDVQPVVESAAGIQINGEGKTIDWAVHMIQFEQSRQADRLLESGALTRTHLQRFGASLARLHKQLPRSPPDTDHTRALLDNFDTMRDLASTHPFENTLAELEAHTRSDIDDAAALLEARLAAGFVRECHGDLHLSNMVMTASGLRAFDCLEFDAGLRNIDVWCDCAFLLMDCAVRDRGDLGYAFIDGYLSSSGDYEGLLLLPMYARYRSMVRAKVAALRLGQSGDDSMATRKLTRHIRWASEHVQRPPGRLLITCGLTGSGKSYWASRLVPELSALRLRSDVLRKTQQDLHPLADSGSDVAQGIYTDVHSRQVYDTLARLAAALLAAGETVIIDAANLLADQRQRLYKAAAAVGSDCITLYFTAPKATLLQRITARASDGGDASEANARVLDWQIDHAELPGSDEPLLSLNTQTLTTQELVTRITSGA